MFLPALTVRTLPLGPLMARFRLAVSTDETVPSSFPVSTARKARIL